jgi:alpha-1,3-rhamnosyl/mannosyltransferase
MNETKSRLFIKLASYGIRPPVDINQQPVDLTIFPNFTTLSTVNSRLCATVIHDLTYLYFPELVEKKNLAHLRRIVPRSVKKADFITVSESVKSEIVKEFHIPAEKCVVTPIPPNQLFFDKVSSSQINTVKKKYGIEKKYIYFIGNLEPRKNLKSLIQAYCLLPQVVKNEYGLILAGGKGWKTEETQKALDEAIATGEDIKHLGFIDQMDSPSLYQGASLFVMPSLYEGFGMPVLEAMASGCNVLTNDIPVLRETGGSAASYANATNPEKLSEAIQASLTSPRPATILQKQATQWSWEDNVHAIMDKANFLLEGNHRD